MTVTARPTPPELSFAGGFDPYVVRDDFPILSTTVNGKPLVYLDSASTSQKPNVVIEAVDTFYREYNANVHRGIYTIGERSTAAYERARATVAQSVPRPRFEARRFATRSDRYCSEIWKKQPGPASPISFYPAIQLGF